LSVAHRCCAMLAEAALAGAVFVGVWYYLVQIKSHDDDDEMYTAFFNPSASPVATPHAFAKILQRMPKGSTVLDLGVGSGVYLEHPLVHQIIRERNLMVDGVDISAPNVAICEARIKKAGLQKQFTAVCQDARTLDAAGKYDAILFMESFPCMSKALFLDIFKSVQRFLKPATGVNYLYHNLGDPKKIGVVERLVGKVMKPTIKLFIGIDFGRLTMMSQMDELVRLGAPGAPPYEDEVLLSAKFSDTDIKLDGVTNWWYRAWGTFFVAVLSQGGPPMEQHLITIRQPKNKAQ